MYEDSALAESVPAKLCLMSRGPRFPNSRVDEDQVPVSDVLHIGLPGIDRDVPLLL